MYCHMLSSYLSVCQSHLYMALGRVPNVAIEQSLCPHYDSTHVHASCTTGHRLPDFRKPNLLCPADAWRYICILKLPYPTLPYPTRKRVLIKAWPLFMRRQPPKPATGPGTAPRSAARLLHGASGQRLIYLTVPK